MYKGKHIRRRGLWIALTWALILLVVVLISIPFIEPYRLETEIVQLTSSDLSQGPKALRVVFVSDFDQGGWPYLTQGRANSIITQVNSLNPDLLLLGGDYAANPEGTVAFFENLPRINAGHVFAVLGETDRASNEQVNILREALKEKNITLLVNEVASVNYGDGGIIKIAGIDEPINGQPDLNAVAKQVRTSDYVILLGHNPSVIEDATRASDQNGRQDWFDLALFGHTHGNQFFGSFNPLGIATDVVTSSHRKGWVREVHDTPILISRGVGTSKLPVRLGCMPQIHCIDIKSTQSTP